MTLNVETKSSSIS